VAGNCNCRQKGIIIVVRHAGKYEFYAKPEPHIEGLDGSEVTVPSDYTLDLWKDKGAEPTIENLFHSDDGKCVQCYKFWSSFDVEAVETDAAGQMALTLAELGLDFCHASHGIGLFPVFC
jgi:hypothetical protein